MPTLTPEQQEHANQVRTVLQKYADTFATVLPEEIQKTPPYIFNLSSTNTDVLNLDLREPQTVDAYTVNEIHSHGAVWGIGKYDEDRVVYRQSDLFNNGVDEPRSVHLAYDLWSPAGTALHAPLAGTVHSFANNDQFLDYGYTIILQHTLDDVTFYTLYGHLSAESIQSLSVGKQIDRGEQFAWIGDIHENGQWSPHVHFQIITNMLGHEGDFPGVAKLSEREFWLTICPDPNLIIRA